MQRLLEDSFCDPLMLSRLIESTIDVPAGASHSRVQEFARRMGYSTWKKPNYLYNVLTGKQKVDFAWTMRAAKVLEVSPFRLLPGWIVKSCIEDFFLELRENGAPAALTQALIKGEPILPEHKEYSRIFQQVIIMKDHSMAPSIEKGVQLKIVEDNLLGSDEFLPGHPYYVELKSGEYLIRQVFFDHRMKRYILSPVNKSFSPDPVPSDDIARISKVLPEASTWHS